MKAEYPNHLDYMGVSFLLCQSRLEPMTLRMVLWTILVKNGLKSASDQGLGTPLQATTIDENLAKKRWRALPGE